MADTRKTTKADVDDTTKASLENAVNNSQGDPRQLTEEDVQAASPPPVEPDTHDTGTSDTKK